MSKARIAAVKSEPVVEAQPGPVEKWYRITRKAGLLSVWVIETQDGRVVDRMLALEPDIRSVVMSKISDAMEGDALAEEEARNT